MIFSFGRVQSIAEKIGDDGSNSFPVDALGAIPSSRPLRRASLRADNAVLGNRQIFVQG